MQIRCELGRVNIVLNTFSVRGGWIGGATAYLEGCHCLSGGSYSDNKASLSSSETAVELPTGTELGKNYIQNKFLD